LYFAQKSIRYLNELKTFEESLINIIEKIHSNSNLKEILTIEHHTIINGRHKIVITFLGSLKSIKSSVINFLLDRGSDKDLCPTGNEESTGRLTKITYGDHVRLALVNRNDGTTEEIPDITEDNLLEEAAKLIKLQAEDRSKKCGDEIIIEIPVEELRDIELWDIPGFDENMVIDRRINEIVKDADVIFGLIPVQDSLKKSFEDFIKPYLRQNRNYELTQQQSSAATSEEEVDHQKIKLIENEECEGLNLFNKLKSQLEVKLGDDAATSSRFIPMCTHYIFSIKDYLESRLSFIEKSTTWFDLAVKLITSYRLDYLIQSLHILLDYDDFN
ncbi:unnamed protein product, partial [Didymodactylos carnosus]